MGWDRELYPNEQTLTAEDAERIADAIHAAYPNQDFFYLRLRNKWGLDVADDIGGLNRGNRLIRADIVSLAKSKGQLLDLLGVTWTDVPGNPLLQQLADAWLPDQAAVADKYALPPLQPAAPIAAKARPPLEAAVATRSRLVYLPVLIAKLELLSQALCRVCIPKADGGGEAALTPNGTGFLVGRRSVLTNYHVVRRVLAANGTGDQVACQFDFTGQPAAVTFSAVTGAGWCRTKRPYSQSDLDGRGDPAPDELDYALITLAQDVEPTRRAIDWPDAPPIVAQRDFLLIGQHPHGNAAQIAFGEVVSLPGSGLRYRYDVTTDHGSSGSPVFDMDLGLVALHHAADPDTAPVYNQGVPIARIMKALKDDGVDLATL